MPSDTDLPPPLHRPRAFVPDLLRRDISPPRSTCRALADAQEAAGRLDAAIARLTLRDEFVRLTGKLEARHSADLDGVLTATNEALAGDLPGSVTPDVDERLHGYQNCGRQAVETIRTGRPWDDILLRRLSATLAGNPGAEMPWREQAEWLGDRHQPDGLLLMPPGQELRELTAQWCQWMNSESDLLRVAKIAVAMVQLILIHPVSGTGHIARLIPTLELMRAEILHEPVLPIAGWLWRHGRGYLEALRGVVHRGELDAWMLFVANAIRAACLGHLDLIARLEQVCDDMLSAVSRKTAIVTLVEALITRPIINLQEIAAICDVSSSHAPALARQLHKAGLATIMNPRTLEGQPEDSSHGKVVVATSIVRLLGVYQPDPSDRDRAVLA